MRKTAGSAGRKARQTNSFQGLSDRANIRSLRAFLALLYFELNALVLSQGLETRAALDLAEMREQVFTTAFGGNEPEAFAIIKPLNSTNLGRHINFSIKIKKMRSTCQRSAETRKTIFEGETRPGPVKQALERRQTDAEGTF